MPIFVTNKQKQNMIKVPTIITDQLLQLQLNGQVFLVMSDPPKAELRYEHLIDDKKFYRTVEDRALVTKAMHDDLFKLLDHQYTVRSIPGVIALPVLEVELKPLKIVNAHE